MRGGTVRYLKDAVDVVLLLRRFVEEGALGAPAIVVQLRQHQRLQGVRDGPGEAGVRLKVFHVVGVPGQLLVGQLLEDLGEGR